MTERIKLTDEDIIIINHKEKSEVDKIKAQILSDYEIVNSLKEKLDTRCKTMFCWDHVCSYELHNGGSGCVCGEKK